MSFMKKFLTAMLLGLVSLALAGASFAAELPELPKLDEPVLLTPFGQSQDANFVNLMMKKNEVDYNLTVTAETGDWAKYKTMIVVLGGSGKGLGAAGLDVPGEVARCKALLEKAKENGLFVLGLHIGGPDRRGPNSQPFLDFAGEADFMIVRSDGNADGYFTRLCEEKKVPLYGIEKTSELRGILGSMFAK